MFRSPDPLARRIALVRNATLGTSTTEQHLDALIICLLDQVRTIAAERVRSYWETLDAEHYPWIDWRPYALQRSLYNTVYENDGVIIFAPRQN